MCQCDFRPKFGSVVTLTDGGEFLQHVDEENPDVIVIVNIYENVSRS